VEVPSGGSCARCKTVVYCGVAHQRADWRRHRGECTPLPAYRVVVVEGKGRGLVATRTLEVGELVMSEKPLLVMSGPDSPATFMEMLKKYDEVPDAVKTRIKDMAVDETGGRFDNEFWVRDNKDWVLLMKIFATNCVELPDEGYALYDKPSFINHSCSPNVCVTAYREGGMVVRVCRRVKEGEEMLANYRCRKISTREERMAEMKGRFMCRCDLCALTGDDLKRNEIARKVIQQLEKKVQEVFRRREYPLAFKVQVQKVEAMEKIKDELVLQLPEALSQCYMLAALAGREEEAARYKERTLALVTTLGREWRNNVEEQLRQWAIKNQDHLEWHPQYGRNARASRPGN